MIIPYIGALKAWLYMPVFSRTGIRSHLSLRQRRLRNEMEGAIEHLVAIRAAGGRARAAVLSPGDCGRSFHESFQEDSSALHPENAHEKTEEHSLEAKCC